MVTDDWKKTTVPLQNNNQQNLMPSDAAWQGSRSSVEKDDWKKTTVPLQNNNQQNLMPSDAAWQGSRSSVEKKNKGGGGTTNQINHL